MSPNIFYIITFQKVMVTTRLRKYKSPGFRGQILHYIKCVWGQETTRKKRKKNSCIVSNFQENVHNMTKYECNSQLRIWQESGKNWLWKRDKSTLISFSESSWDTYYKKIFKKRNIVKKLLKIQPLKMFKVKTHQSQNNAGHYSKVEKGI